MTVGATRFHVWRCYFALILTVGCSGILAGCASISMPPSSSLGERGGRATSVAKVGAWYLIGTASVVPGQAHPWPAEWEVRRCGENHLEIEVLAAKNTLDSDSESALCTAAHKAIRYVAFGPWSIDASVKFRIYLLPKGMEVRRQHRAWTIKKTAVVEYAFQMNADESSVASVISAVAHEAFHLYGALAALTPSVRGNEDLAYTFGACAQLNAIGWLRGQDMPNAELSETSVGISRAMLISSRAGVRLIDKFRPYFDESGEIRSPSQGADSALDYCRKTLFIPH